MKEAAQQNKRTRRSSRGSVAVEFAFVAPVLLTLMAGAFELSRVIFNYQLVLAAAYEGARAGSQIDPSALGEGCFGTTGLDHDTATSGSPERMVMDRVEYLLNLQGSSMSLEEPKISAEIVKVTNGQAMSADDACSSASKENTIAIRIRGNYRPALLSFFSIPLSVESRAYLLANNKTFSTTSNPNPAGSCGGVSSGSYEKSEHFFAADGGPPILILSVAPPPEEEPDKEKAINDLCGASRQAQQAADGVE